MTYEQINEMMEEMGLPFAYHHFAEGESPPPPFLIFLSPGESTFSADNYMYYGVYYVINNNAGYTGDLEIALITTEFATEILGEILDNNGVLVEKNDGELSQFALMFEFLGDKHHIRHVMYCCSASRPATESSTTEESTEVKTEKLTLKATPLPTGLVKSKTTESTSDTVYNNWFKMPYNPSTESKTTTTTTKTS